MMKRAIAMTWWMLVPAACGSVSANQVDAGDDDGSSTDIDAATDGDGGPPVGFAIGGTVAGLGRSPLVLALGGEELAIHEDGTFTFTTRLDAGQRYQVDIADQPTGQTCALAAGAGIMAAADVTDVDVHCYSAVFTVGETIDVVDGNPGDGACQTLDGVCTLRAAVQEAVAAGTDALILLPPATLVVTLAGVDEVNPASGDLDLSGGEIRVIGQGASATVIDAGDVTGIFDVQNGRAVVDGVTLQNGNSAAYGGGAVRVRAGAEMILRESVVRSHAGNFNGTAILNEGSLAIVRSRVTDNQSLNGGGILNEGALALRESLVDTNTASVRGGGIALFSGTASFTSTTFSGNSSNLESATEGGGALYVSAGVTADLLHVTMTGNAAQSGASGGGINAETGATVTLTSTILGGNTGNAPDCIGQLASGGTNLVGNPLDCQFAAERSDQLDLDPQLAALASIGRGPPAHKPASGSPARDAAAAGTCPTHDQVGQPRPIDGDGDREPACDIGAIEAAPE